MNFLFQTKVRRYIMPRISCPFSFASFLTCQSNILYTFSQMPNYNDIPVEILRQIFKYAEESTRYKKSWMIQYQLVCKSWNLAAKLWLYNFVDLSSDQDSDRFLRCIKSSSAGQFTCTIYIDTSHMKRETEKHYIKELVKVPPKHKICYW
jgi:hypothetical protein